MGDILTPRLFDEQGKFVKQTDPLLDEIGTATSWKRCRDWLLEQKDDDVPNPVSLIQLLVTQRRKPGENALQWLISINVLKARLTTEAIILPESVYLWHYRLQLTKLERRSLERKKTLKAYLKKQSKNTPTQMISRDMTLGRTLITLTGSFQQGKNL